MKIFDIIYNSEMFNQWVTNHLISNSIFMILGIFIILGTIFIARKYIKSDDSWDSDTGTVIFFSVIPITIGVIMTFSCLSEIIQFLTGPQGMFLSAVLNMFD